MDSFCTVYTVQKYVYVLIQYAVPDVVMERFAHSARFRLSFDLREQTRLVVYLPNYVRR